MKILLISGHGAGDPGAVGNGVTEEEKNIEIVRLVEKYLKAYATVDVYDTNRNAYEDVKNGAFNIGKYGYVMEFHFNAFDGTATGTECYVVSSEAGIKVEQAVMQELSKFFKLRDNDGEFDGVKRTNFSVINKVKALGMSGALYEICFIDNPSDMAIYEKEKENIAKAIVSGVCEGFGLSKSQGDEEADTESNLDIEDTSTKIPSITVMAKEVIAGEHGNGHEVRKASLEKKYGEIDYEAVRAEVNGIINGTSTAAVSVTTMAKEVIAGEHGNGHETRKASLEKKYGAIDYEAVRAKVNELLA